MTQARWGGGEGGCSLTATETVLLAGGQRHHRPGDPPKCSAHQCPQQHGEPEGDSAIQHQPGQNRWAMLSLSLSLGKGLRCPVRWQRRRKAPGTQGMQAHPKLQQTNFLDTPGPPRSKETQPGRSRDQRGACCHNIPSISQTCRLRGAQPTTAKTYPAALPCRWRAAWWRHPH